MYFIRVSIRHILIEMASLTGHFNRLSPEECITAYFKQMELQVLVHDWQIHSILVQCPAKWLVVAPAGQHLCMCCMSCYCYFIVKSRDCLPLTYLMQFERAAKLDSSRAQKILIGNSLIRTWFQSKVNPVRLNPIQSNLNPISNLVIKGYRLNTEILYSQYSLIDHPRRNSNVQ